MKSLITAALLLTLTSPSQAGDAPTFVGPDPDKKIGQGRVIIWVNGYAMDRGRALLREGPIQAATRYVACVVENGTKVEYFGTTGQGDGPRRPQRRV